MLPKRSSLLRYSACLILLVLHVLLQYHREWLVQQGGYNTINKSVFLLANVLLFALMLWILTQAKQKVYAFLLTALFLAALSTIGFFLERTQVSFGFFLSMLRSTFLDTPLLLVLFLADIYLRPVK